jgi:hypothetical protein
MGLYQVGAVRIILGVDNDADIEFKLIKQFNQTPFANTIAIFTPQPTALTPGLSLPIQIHTALNAIRKVLDIDSNIKRQPFVVGPIELRARFNT